MFCNQCGRGLTAEDKFCVGCGMKNSTLDNTSNTSNMGDSFGQSQPLSPTMGGQDAFGRSTHQQKNTMATAGFICAIIGLFIPVLEILGLIFSIIGLRRSKQLGGAGRGLAIAGIVLAIIGIILLIMILPEMIEAFQEGFEAGRNSGNN